MSKYDDRTAAAIERQLARRYRNRQSDRAWAAERQRVMGYVALGCGSKTIAAVDDAHEAVVNIDTEVQP